VKFSIATAWVPHTELVPIAKAADELGYHALSLPDHVVDIETLETPYPYTRDGARRWTVGDEWPDPWVTVGHLSAVTSRLTFFTSVYVAAMRSPYQVAKTVGTASVLSGGRVALGVGIGWCREEFDLLEQSFTRRGRRTDEALALIERLWEPGVVDFDGEVWQAPPMYMEPSPAAKVPIYVGGLSDVGIARAARHDGWIGDIFTIDEAAGWATRLAEARAAIGKTGDFEVIVALIDALTPDDFHRAEERGVTMTMTAPWAYYFGTHATLDQKLEGMERFAKDVLSAL